MDFQHIEFIGAPGVGKSTIHAALTDHNPWYCPAPRTACRRRFLTTADLKFRLAYQAMPRSVRSLFEQTVLVNRYRQEAFERFVARYPEAAQSIAGGFWAAEDQPVELFKLIRRAIERYQLGTDTVRARETVCLDEGFGMLAFSIMRRRPSEAFSLETYLQQTPTPDLLVHVDAPPDLSLRRQHDRGRVEHPCAEQRSEDTLMDIQEQYRQLAASIAEEYRDRAIVVDINNEERLQESVDRLTRTLTTE